MTHRTLTALLCLVAAGPAWADGWEIELRERVDVPGRKIYLSDVAVLRSGSSALAALSLGVTPEPGERLVLSRETIARRVDAWSDAPLSIGGAAQVEVRAQTATLLGRSVLNQARRHVARELGGRLEPAAPLPPAEWVVPVGRQRTSLKVTWEQSHSSVRARVEVWLDGQPWGGLPVGFRVAEHAAAPAGVAAVDTPLADSGASSRRDPEPNPPIPTRRPRRAAEPQRAGPGRRGPAPRRAQPPVSDAPLAVEADEHVSVAIHKGALTVTGDGVALEAGAVGELVAVQVGGRKTAVRARVIAPGRVELALGAESGGTP